MVVTALFGGIAPADANGAPFRAALTGALINETHCPTCVVGFSTASRRRLLDATLAFNLTGFPTSAAADAVYTRLMTDSALTV